MSAVRALGRAALSAALLVSAVGAAPSFARGALSPGQDLRTLPSGALAILQPDPQQPVAALGLWFRAPSGGFDAAAVPGISRFAATAIADSAPITGTPLAELIRREGGRLTISAFPDSISVTAVVPPDVAAATLRAMTTAYFAPVLTDAGITATRGDAASDALVRSFDPDDATEDALDTVLFPDGPFHFGRIGQVPALRSVTAAAVRAFTERAFAPANAVVVLTGAVGPDALDAVTARSAGNAGVLATPPPIPAYTAPAAPMVISDANVEASGLGWRGPAIADEDAATSMDFLAASLFSANGAVTRALVGHKATASARFVTYHAPGIFLVTITGAEADAVRPLVAAAIAAAATPMAPAAFDAARARFYFGVLQDDTSAALVNDTNGWYTLEGAPGYSPGAVPLHGRYATIARALTARGVAAVAARYLTTPPAIVTLHRAAPPSGARAS